MNQFHSNLSFIPEHNLGIFVSYNSDPSSRARSNVVAAFLDYFISAEFPEHIEPDLDVNLDVEDDIPGQPQLWELPAYPAGGSMRAPAFSA